MNCGPVFYTDMSDADAKIWCQKLEVHALTKPPLPVESPCWDLDVPIMYIICTRDHATPLELQNMMIDRVKRDHWIIEHCESDHSPYLSQPDTIVDLIKKPAGVAEISNV